MNYIIKKQFLLLLEGYLQVDSIYRIFLTASVDVNSQSSFAIYWWHSVVNEFISLDPLDEKKNSDKMT